MKANAQTRVIMVFGEALTLEAAAAKGLAGCWWAALALAEGIEVAAAHPLVAEQEGEARKMARYMSSRITDDPFVLARPFAMCPTDAQEAYGAAVALVDSYFQSENPLPELQREMAMALADAEERGRRSALIARCTYLAVRARRVKTRKNRL